MLFLHIPMQFELRSMSCMSLSPFTSFFFWECCSSVSDMGVHILKLYDHLQRSVYVVVVPLPRVPLLSCLDTCQPCLCTLCAFSISSFNNKLSNVWELNCRYRRNTYYAVKSVVGVLVVPIPIPMTSPKT